MAIPAWKRFEKSQWFQHTKAKLKRLIGKELTIHTDIELDTVVDGDWHYAAGQLDEFGIVYSLGVGDTIDFDLALIERSGAMVHAFDPTPSSFDTLESSDLPREFRFHPWAVAGEDGELKLYPRQKASGGKSETMYTLVAEDGVTDEPIVAPAYTLASIVDKLGHARIDLLKMDIEGAEYEVLDGLLESPVLPTQLLVEFHHRFVENGLDRTYDIIARLREAGYRIFAISEIGREVSFLRQ